MLRCLSRVALLGTLLVLGFGFQPMAAHAAVNASTTTVDYSLTTSSTIGVPGANIKDPQVEALITPTGGVVPPTLSSGQEGSPFTVVPDSTGFDPSQLIVLLRDAKSSSGPEQELGLIFYGQGLQAGGHLHFALSINSALASDPPELHSLTQGVTITADSPPAATTTTAGASGNGGSSSGSSTNNVVSNPEPLSVILWSAVIVGVVARNRMLSRRMAD